MKKIALLLIAAVAAFACQKPATEAPEITVTTTDLTLPLEGTEDFKVELFDKAAFDGLRNEKIADFVGYILDKNTTKLKEIFGDINVGELVQLANVDLKVEDGKWLLKGEPALNVLQQLFNIDVKTVISWIEDKDYRKIINDVLGDLTFQQVIREDFKVELFDKAADTAKANREHLERLVALYAPKED